MIHNFGREELVDRESLVRLVRSIQRFLGGEDGLRAGGPHGFEFLTSRSYLSTPRKGARQYAPQ